MVTVPVIAEQQQHQQPQQQQYMQYLLSHGNDENNDNVNIRPDSFYMAVEQFEQANRQLTMSCLPSQQAPPPPPLPRSYMMVSLEQNPDSTLSNTSPQMSRTTTPMATTRQVYFEDTSQQQPQHSSSLPSSLGMCYHNYDDNVRSENQHGTPGQDFRCYENVVEECNVSTNRAQSLTYLPYSSSSSSSSPSWHAQTQPSSARLQPTPSSHQLLSSLSMSQIPPLPQQQPRLTPTISTSSLMDNSSVNHLSDIEGYNNLQLYASHHSNLPVRSLHPQSSTSNLHLSQQQVFTQQPASVSF